MNDSDTNDSPDSNGLSTETSPTRPISYAEALRRLEIVADSQPLANPSDQEEHPPATNEQAAQKRSFSPSIDDPGRVVSILKAVGCTSINTIHAPCPTPYNDISSMDGFAVSSKLTEHATPTSPVKFKVIDDVAAADLHYSTTIREGSSVEDEREPECVETMTGARFPATTHLELDAVVEIEDVEVVREDGRCTYVLVTEPVRPYQNKRSAGSDFSINQVVLWAGETIKPKHVMGLAAIGMSKVEVVATDSQTKRRGSHGQPRVAILSTGANLVDITKVEHKDFVAARQYEQATPDSNGPYVVSALKFAGLTFDTRYLGVILNDEKELLQQLQTSIESDRLDVLIVNGGVSVGRLDTLRRAVEDGLRGLIVFHGVNVRPGLPILFAVVTVPASSHGRHETRMAERNVAIFGLPDNPVAAAAVVRFFVVPYMTMLTYGCLERPSHWAKLQAGDKTSSPSEKASNVRRPSNSPHDLKKPAHLTAFWTAKRFEEGAKGRAHGAESKVCVLGDQSSCSVKSLFEGNCWVIAAEGVSTHEEGDEVAIASLL